MPFRGLLKRKDSLYLSFYSKKYLSMKSLFLSALLLSSITLFAQQVNSEVDGCTPKIWKNVSIN